MWEIKEEIMSKYEKEEVEGIRGSIIDFWKNKHGWIQRRRRMEMIKFIKEEKKVGEKREIPMKGLSIVDQLFLLSLNGGNILPKEKTKNKSLMVSTRNIRKGKGGLWAEAANIHEWKEDVVIVTETGWGPVEEGIRKIYNTEWMEVRDAVANTKKHEGKVIENEEEEQKSNRRGVSIMVNEKNGIKTVKGVKSRTGNMVGAEIDVGER